MRLADLAKLVGAQLVSPGGDAGAESVEITATAPIESADGQALCFLNNDQYAAHLKTTRAGAVILKAADPSCKRPQLVHANPYWAFAKASQALYPATRPVAGVSEKAHVSPGAKVGKGTQIDPFVFIGKDAVIGDNVIVKAGTYIGHEARVGDDSIIAANVVLEDRCEIGKRVIVHGGAVIGGDGFGFAPGPAGIEKIPQVGIVHIGDDVEIGSNTSIDRAAMAVTAIGKGTKIDSAVHVGHNVEVGAHSMLCGQVGIAGSAKIGSGVVLAGQVGINNHVTIADGITVGAKAGVTKSLTDKDTYMGFPAEPVREYRRFQVSLRFVPDLIKRVKELERRLKSDPGE